MPLHIVLMITIASESWGTGVSAITHLSCIEIVNLFVPKYIQAILDRADKQSRLW